MSVTVPISLFNDISSIERKLDQRKIELAGNSGIYNVMEYGAVGDGLIDDTAKIQALIALLNDGDTLFFPKGHYLISGILTISKKINLLGVGIGSQIFQSADLDLFSYTSSQQGIYIEDLYLGSSATTATKSLLKLTNTHRSYINNVILYGGYYGIWLNGSLCNAIINPQSGSFIGGFFAATSTTQYFIYGSKTGGIAPNANRIYNPVLEVGVNGIYIDGDGEGGISIYGGTLESLTNIGIQVVDCYLPTVISGLHFESNTVADIQITNSQAVTIGGTDGGVFCDGLVDIVSTDHISIVDSYIDKIAIASGCRNVVIRDVRFNGSAAGYVHDYGENTRIDNLINAGNNGDYQEGINVANPLPINFNGGMELWVAGLPSGFGNLLFGGNQATIVQTGTGMGDTNKKFGDYAAKVTGHVLETSTGLYYDLPAGIKGQWISVEAWIYLVSGTSNIQLWTDGGASVYTVSGADKTGEWLRVTASFSDFDAADTSAFILFQFPLGSVGYVDNVKIYVTSPHDPSLGRFTTLSVNNFTVTVLGNSTINGSLVGNITGGGTLATGGFTLTVPATGSAVLGTGTQYQLGIWTGTNNITGLGSLGNTNAVLQSAGVGANPAWSGFYLTGIAGGTTNLAITNTKTLTLTATDNYNLTIPATGTAALLQVANVFTANQTISNTAPSLTLTDTTASAKSLKIAVDADFAELIEASALAGSLLTLDLTNHRIGIGSGAPAPLGGFGADAMIQIGSASYQRGGLVIGGGGGAGARVQFNTLAASGTGQIQNFAAGTYVSSITFPANTKDIYCYTNSDTSNWKLHIGTTTIDIGGPTNYVEITTAGELTLKGTATVWNDANVGTLVLQTGGTLPGIVEFLDNDGDATGIYTRGFAIGEEGSGAIELPHDYKEGSDITFHIHWGANDAPTGTDYVKWQLTYTLARGEVTLADSVVIVMAKRR